MNGTFQAANLTFDWVKTRNKQQLTTLSPAYYSNRHSYSSNAVSNLEYMVNQSGKHDFACHVRIDSLVWTSNIITINIFGKF